MGPLYALAMMDQLKYQRNFVMDANNANPRLEALKLEMFPGWV
jgi:hypothetical protein